jgi:hypothetical protein
MGLHDADSAPPVIAAGVGTFTNVIPIVLRAAERAALLKDDRLEISVDAEGRVSARMVGGSHTSSKQLPRQLAGADELPPSFGLQEPEAAY